MVFQCSVIFVATLHFLTCLAYGLPSCVFFCFVLGFKVVAHFQSYLTNTPTNLCTALLNFSLFCLVLHRYAFVQYCKAKTIQYNAMHKIFGVLDNPRRFVVLICNSLAAWSAWHGSQLCVRNFFSVFDPGTFTQQFINAGPYKIFNWSLILFYRISSVSRGRVFMQKLMRNSLLNESRFLRRHSVFCFS